MSRPTFRLLLCEVAEIVKSVPAGEEPGASFLTPHPSRLQIVLPLEDPDHAEHLFDRRHSGHNLPGAGERGGSAIGWR